MPGDLERELAGTGLVVVPWRGSGPGRLVEPGALAAFGRALDAALSGAGTRGIVVTGAGEGPFGDGLDPEWLHPATLSEAAPAGLLAALRDMAAVLDRLNGASVPTWALIQGSAFGPALEIALACREILVANEPGVEVGLTGIRHALPPMLGGTTRVAGRIGAERALDVILDGRVLRPEAALDRGLVDLAVPAADLADALRNRLDRQGEVNAPQRSGGEPGVGSAISDIPPGPGAPRAIVEAAVQAELAGGAAAGLSAFVEAARSPVARVMVRTQLLEVGRARRLRARPRHVPTARFGRSGVLGGGLMGAGIAAVALAAGLDVVLIEVDGPAADRAAARVGAVIEGEVAAGRMAAGDARRALARLTATNDFAALRDVDITVEAVFEDRSVKAAATRRAEEAMRADAIFATNTSTLPISGLAAASVRPENFIGLHFFSPVPRMSLLEVIRGTATTDETLARALDFAAHIGKVPIVVGDSRGFYTSRVIMTYQNEAFEMLAEGVSPERIEAAGRASGMPLPPLLLADAVAVDLIHAINRQRRADGDLSGPPSEAERVAATLVELARPGKKAGRGFYDYPGPGRTALWPGLAELFPARPEQPDSDELVHRLLAIQALEAARCLAEGVIGRAGEADIGAVLGWNYAPWTGGPLSYAELRGEDFEASCERLSARFGERFRLAGRGGAGTTARNL